MILGKQLRKLRREKGVGIKIMASEIAIDHSYLSKIENGYIVPSAEVIGRMARYLNYNNDELMVLANRVPEDIKEILRTNPREAMDFLRKRFGKRQDDH